MTLTKEEGCFKNTKFGTTSGSKKKKRTTIKKRKYFTSLNEEEWHIPIQAAWLYTTKYFKQK